MYITGKQMHQSGTASMNCNGIGQQKPKREQVAEMLLYRDSCCSQNGVRATVSARDLLALLVGCQGDGIVVISPDQTVAWMNKAMEDLFGVSEYETIGMNAVEFISLCISPNLVNGEDLKAEFISSCFFCENIPTRQYCISRTPAERVWVEYSSTVIPTGVSRGARLDIYHTAVDSSRLEASCQEYRQRYELLTALSSDLVVSLDLDLTITSVSPSVKHLLGHNPDNLAGKHLSSIMTRDSVAELQKACFLDRVSRGSAGRSDPAGGARIVEANLTDVRGRQVAVTFGFSLVRDCGGNFTGIIAVAKQKADDNHSDDSVWREVSSQIDQNIEQLACLGDRIRNPLAVIVGLADLEGDEAARKIAGQARVIDGIITELDRGYVASLSARQFLRKHYHLGDGTDLQDGTSHPP